MNELFCYGALPPELANDKYASKLWRDIQSATTSEQLQAIRARIASTPLKKQKMAKLRGELDRAQQAIQTPAGRARPEKRTDSEAATGKTDQPDKLVKDGEEKRQNKYSTVPSGPQGGTSRPPTATQTTATESSAEGKSKGMSITVEADLSETPTSTGNATDTVDSATADWTSITIPGDDPYYASLAGCRYDYDNEKNVLHIAYHDADEGSDAHTETYDITLRQSGVAQELPDIVKAAGHVACVIKTLRCCDGGKHRDFDSAHVRRDGTASLGDGSTLVGEKTPAPIYERSHDGKTGEYWPNRAHYTPEEYKAANGKPTARREIEYHLAEILPGLLDMVIARAKPAGGPEATARERSDSGSTESARQAERDGRSTGAGTSAQGEQLSAAEIQDLMAKLAGGQPTPRRRHWWSLRRGKDGASKP